jgi:hypothetical protein
LSAEVVSGSDRKLPGRGEGVLVSTDGVTFTNAVVLKFDGTTAGEVFKISVKAIDDSAAEGPRVALISHSIISADPDYDGLPLVDVFVNVLDNDKPGLEIRHLSRRLRIRLRRIRRPRSSRVHPASPTSTRSC